MCKKRDILLSCKEMEFESFPPPSPNYGHYSPPPFNCLCKNALYRHLSSRSVDRRRNKWHWTGWLLARAGYVSPCCNVMCLWYMCFCAEVFFFFFCSQTVLQMEHSLGVKIFFFSSSLSSCKKLYLSKYPVSCSVYPVVICMLCMYGQVDG